jgi:hypothetical protein
MKKKNFWSQFWFKDYEADLNLRRCSLAAQGLWMRMLCYMHASEKPGYLIFMGEESVVETLAGLVLTPIDTVKELLEELEKKGVFSKDDDGVIFNRRMAREADLSGIRSKAGKKGGNPNWLKGKKTPPEDVNLDNQNDNQNSGKNPPYILDTRSKKLEEKKKERTYPSDTPGADAPGQAAPDIRKEFWDEGVPILKAITGKTENACRTFLGTALKAAKDDCAMALDVLRQAKANRPVDPGAWIIKSITARMGGDERMRTANEIASAKLRAVVDSAKNPHQDVGLTIDGEGTTLTNDPALQPA